MDAKAAVPQTPEEKARNVEFEARIARGETIEPKDWMPERYRKQLIRMMSQHAHSEIVGMLPEGNWITRAPSAAPQDVAARQGAGRGRPRALHLLRHRDARRRSRTSWSSSCSNGTAKYSSIFNYPDADAGRTSGVIGWFVDGAAIVNQTMLAKASYGPYARAMIRICKEENFHKRQGYEIMATLARGTPAQKAMAQDAREPLVVAVAHDVRAQRHGLAEQRASCSGGASSARATTSCASGSST